MINSTGLNQYRYLDDNTVKTNSVSTDNVTQPINIFETPVDTFEFSTDNSNIFDTENNAKELENELASIQEEQGFIGKAWNGIKSIFGGGSSKVEKNIEKYKNGEISFDEAKESIEKYQAGQKMSVDVVGDIGSGILAVGAFGLAIGSAVVTGGASLPIALGIATAAGAGSKIAIKASDAAVGKREYSAKDLGYDAATGAINGLLSPVTNGVGASVTKTVGTKLGLTVVKEGTEEVIEQGVKQGIKSIITQQGVDVIGGTLKARAVATAAGMAVDGAIGGAADNMVRAALNGEDVFEAGVQGAVGGMIMAPVIGGGFKLAGKAGKALNNKITTSSVMPDGVNTKFAQGAEGDCALLSVLDGMMNSKDAQKKIKSAISSPVGSDFYNVKIGNKSVNVLKSSLADEASDSLSDSKAIRIFELAYKQLQGTDDALDGGFAEVIAKQFGLNPVHISSDAISDEVLDSIAKENKNTVLSLGAFVDGDGNIAESGSRHYFSIKNIDADSKTVKIANPYDSSKVIDLSYDDVKKLGISIDGGSVKETSLPNSVRNSADVLFKGVDVSDTKASLIKTLNEQGAELSDVETILSTITYSNGSSCSLDDIAAMMKQYNISDKQVASFIKARTGSDSLGDWIAIGEGKDLLFDLTKSMQQHSLVQNSGFFDSYKLSLEESSAILHAIDKYDTNELSKILRANNASVFEAIGGEQYIQKNIINISNGFSDMQGIQGITPDNLVKLSAKINGEDKYFVFKNASTITSSSSTPNFETLIKSNMITTDALDVVKECGIDLPKQIKCTFKDLDGNNFDYLFDTAELLAKINEKGYGSLTSREVHALTDTLKNLYKSDSNFAKKISTNKAIQTKGKAVYDAVSYLKQNAQAALKNTNVEIDDHAFMRMIDRNIATVSSNADGTLLDTVTYIQKLAQQAEMSSAKGLKEAVLESYGGSDGIRMIIKKMPNGKVKIESIM